ncbi:hypothetical protein ACFE04_010456 [Oxalis oulophora]
MGRTTGQTPTGTTGERPENRERRWGERGSRCSERVRDPHSLPQSPESIDHHQTLTPSPTPSIETLTSSITRTETTIETLTPSITRTETLAVLTTNVAALNHNPNFTVKLKRYS